MQITLILLLTAIVSMAGALIYLHTKKIIAERKLYEKDKAIKRERKGTAAILELSEKAINSDTSDESFLAHFGEYAQRSLGGIGSAVFISAGNDEFVGCSVSGTFPPLKDVPNQVEQQLLAHPKFHTQFIRDIKIPFSVSRLKELCKENGYYFIKKQEDAPENFFQKTFFKIAKRTVIAPIYCNNTVSAAVIVVSGDDFDTHIIDENDAIFLARLCEIAAMSLNGIRIFRQRREFEKNLQEAKEEGMLQVSAGIIHNIGNAVTVAKLNVAELKEKNKILNADSPESLITNELIPELKKHVNTGDIKEFLTKDPGGSQYFDIISELVGHIAKRSEENAKLASSLSNKLNHISEIIELQQKFVGELGTENITSLAPVIESSVKIFEETFNKKAVFLETEITPDTPEILIDSSMMTQVYINLIKNAVEAMEAENALKEKRIKITLKKENIEGKTFVISEVIDNGPGIAPENLPKMFKFGFSTKEKSRHSRGYGLHSCMETVKKYNGNIEVKSTLGQGTTFIIKIPASQSNTTDLKKL
ncbi:MAG TPA: HAMP domain-containing sensor histidine kinase [Victivallales bacterium]|nr:HAMP domain-containing sensor histidine kinase [Victivallales bacterium]HRR28136.1 HAMP domain-containing sensor histidine kinase [Victivallales bacterium]HRU00301.1 HAMP domain-containing sensor histidine kinase [Victivallales bacterium]